MFAQNLNVGAVLPGKLIIINRHGSDSVTLTSSDDLSGAHVMRFFLSQLFFPLYERRQRLFFLFTVNLMLSREPIFPL